MEIDIKGSPIMICQDDTSIHIAVRDAFDVAERKLKSHSEQLKAKRHRKPVITDMDTGFDEAANG